MPQDSSSIDRRLRCRTCQRPRLRAVSLLTDPVERYRLMAGLLCTDHHSAPLSDSPESQAVRAAWDELAF